MRKLTLRQEARAEFREAIAWYESERPGLGGSFHAAVEHLLTRILESPQQQGGNVVPATTSAEVVREFWRLMATNDFHFVAAVLAPDFVLEWPQSAKEAPWAF